MGPVLALPIETRGYSCFTLPDVALSGYLMRPRQPTLSPYYDGGSSFVWGTRFDAVMTVCVRRVPALTFFRPDVTLYSRVIGTCGVTKDLRCGDEFKREQYQPITADFSN